MSRISTIVDSALPKFVAVVTVKTKDGASRVARYDVDASAPISRAQQERVDAKSDALATAALGADMAAAVASEINGLHEADSVHGLMTLLRSGPKMAGTP